MNDQRVKKDRRIRGGKTKSSRFLARVWLGLMVLAIAIVACSPSVPTPPGTETPLPTETPNRSGSIEGIVWHDVCVNGSTEAEPPEECVEDTATGKLIANGIRDLDETGLPEVWVELGLGSCPSTSFSGFLTDGEGRYLFDGLVPGDYCVIVNAGGTTQQVSLTMGTWTQPEGGMASVSLSPGERRAGVNFGFDFLTKPTPAAPEPTSTPAFTRTCVDAASFVKDVTIADGTRIDPKDSFTKTWRLTNNGTCVWTDEYDLVFISGYRMSGDTVSLNGDIASGQTVDLSVKLEAPKGVGTYQGYWMLRNEVGNLFGVGESSNSPIWVKIIVEPEITDWRGEYFDNQDLKGDPVLIRNDDEIDFNWKSTAPDSDLPSNDFAVRWTRELSFNSGIYRFSIRFDDGARLWVDDRLVIDEWEDGGDRTIGVYLRLVKGRHDVQLEYYENGGAARIHLDVEKISLEDETDWIGLYWFNRTLDSEWALVSTEKAIDFDWDTGSPGLGIPKNDFSARWSRVVEFEPGVYTFYARADDGIRVEVDGDRVINEWHKNNAGERYAVDVTLSGQQLIEVEYYEADGEAKVSFWWKYLGPENQPPVASPDFYETAANEVLDVRAPGVLTNDEDPDGDTIIAVLINGPSKGLFELEEDGSFGYLADPEFIGEDRFTYQVSDGQAASAVVTVSIQVLPVNTPPTAVDDSYEINEDEILQIEAPGILANDSDPDGQVLEILLEGEPTSGSLELREDGSFEYIPIADFNGQDGFTYRLSDGVATSELASVQIMVLSVNDIPMAVEDLVTGKTDEILEIDVLANDDGLGDGPVTLSIEVSPIVGTVEIVDGKVVYTPKVGFNGEDGFEYAVTDTEGERSQARVFVNLGSMEE